MKFKKRNILSMISFIIAMVLIFLIFKIDMLPVKYSVLLSILLLFIQAIFIVLLNNKRKVFKVISSIILILSSVINIIFIYYLSVTNSYLNKSFSNVIESKSEYYVISLKKNNYKESDIKGNIATYKSTLNIDDAFNKLSKSYKVNNVSYNDLNKMISSVSDNTNRFMLMDSSSYEIVFSLNKDLKRDDYDIIYKFNLYKKIKTKDSKSDNFNVFIGGRDFAKLMDFNMILSINTKNNTVLMTSIPRDYYLEVPGKNGLKDKLSFINAYGEDMNRKTLEKLFDTKIDYQVIFNTSSLVKITDYVGGIEFCSDKSYTTTHALIQDSYDDSKGVKFRVKKGCQHLNGIQTLTVARERLNLYGGDKARQENCQKIMLAIFKKLASSKTLVNYNETLNELSDLYETNISRSIVSSLISNYIDNPKDWTINYQIVDGTAGNDLVHSSSTLKDYVTYPNYDMVNEAKLKIKEVLK